MPKTFYFPAKADAVPVYARQIVDALGEAFDQSLIMASISEALLNAIAYGALQLPGSTPDRDPVEFAELLRDAEARSSASTGVAVVVGRTEDDPLDKLVTIRDPGPGFDWRAKLEALADKSVRPSVEDLLDTSGRGLSIMLAGARAVAWNDKGNEVVLRYRPPGAPPARSKPPAPIRINVNPSERTVSATAVTLPGVRAVRVPVDIPPLRSDRPPSPPRPPETTPPEPAPASSHPAAGPSIDGTRVLVVDDVEVNRRILQHMLNWDGFDVRVAPDGPSALELMQHWQPEVMVLDVHMPKMSGIDVVLAMRARGMLIKTSVLLLTAATVDDQLRSEGLEAGACDFLEKPISRRELIARVRRRVEMRRDLEQLSAERANVQESVVAAGEVMRALMPEPLIELAIARITTLVIPCQAVGGDVVDFVHIDADRWLISLVDVAGHGLAAALTASSSRAILRDRLMSGRSLGDALTALNLRLSEDFDRTGQQASVVAMLVDEKSREAHLLNAGCPPALALQRDGAWRTLVSTAPPAGLLPEAGFSVTVEPIDALRRVILLSDGLTEAFARSSDSIGALRTLIGNELDTAEAIPTDAIRDKVEALGPSRDDASIAWIEFCSRPDA